MLWCIQTECMLDLNLENPIIFKVNNMMKYIYVTKCY